MTHWQQVNAVPSDSELASGLAAIQQATDPNRLASASPRERQYALALKAFYTNYTSISHEQRVLNYEREMLNLYTSYGSSDPEAALFYALSIVARTTTFGHQAAVNYRDNRRAGHIVELVLSSYPKHPGAMHYLMQAYNNPVLAPLGRDVALMYEETDSLHQFRPMSFRIFARLGMWDDLQKRAFEQMDAFTGPTTRSPQVAAGVPETPDSLRDAWLDAAAYYHYACLQRAEDKAASYLVEQILLRRNMSNPSSLIGSWQYFGMFSRHFMDLEMWTQLLSFSYSGGVAPNPRDNILVAFNRIIGASRGGRSDVRFVLRDAAATVADANRTLSAWPQWRQMTNTQKAEIYALVGAATAWRNYADGDLVEAVHILEQVDDLFVSFVAPALPLVNPHEQIGDLYTTADQSVNAGKSYEKSLSLYPRRFTATYGTGIGYMNSGDDWNTTLWFNRIVSLCGPTECSSRKYMSVVKQYLQDLTTQLRMDGWGLFLILAGGAFISVTLAGAVALHYRENPVWADFLS
jgi:hypothetical protein